MKLINIDGHSFNVDIATGKLLHRRFDNIAFENGHIVADSKPEIDMGGRTLIPGLTDSHVHFLQTGFLYSGGDMSDVESEDELLARVSKGISSRDFFQSWGYDPKEGLPHRSQLDAISRDKPIFIRRRDGHSSVINKKAVEMLTDVLKKHPGQFDLESGFLRSDAHMEAEHVFLNMATSEDLDRARSIVQERVISRGVTAIHCLVHRSDWAKFIMESDNMLDLPIFLESWEVQDAVNLGLKRIGGCLLLDGSFGSHTAALLEPYADKDSCGCLYQDNKKLKSFLKSAVVQNIQTAFHAIGDGAVNQIMDIHLEVSEEYYPPLRHRIEHSELVPDRHFENIKRLGIILSVQPVFEYLWGGSSGLYNDRIGIRHRFSNRYRTLRENGIILTGGSDSYVTPLDPLLGVHAAVNHPNTDERLSVEEALAMFTIAPRIASHTEGRVGELTVGKEATFVLLEESPWERSADIKDISVSETWIKGKRVYRA